MPHGLYLGGCRKRVRSRWRWRRGSWSGGRSLRRRRGRSHERLGRCWNHEFWYRHFRHDHSWHRNERHNLGNHRDDRHCSRDRIGSDRNVSVWHGARPKWAKYCRHIGNAFRGGAIVNTGDRERVNPRPVIGIERNDKRDHHTLGLRASGTPSVPLAAYYVSPAHICDDTRVA
jgi:hypothetical protein